MKGGFFFALPDGSLSGQYGSIPGDSIKLPKGTVDFSKLVVFVSKSQSEGGGVGIQAAIRHEGELSVNFNPLKDDSIFRNIFLKHRGDWEGWLGGKPSERVHKMMSKIKYFKGA